MNTEPKFKIGQVVKFAGDSNAEAGKVLSYSFDGESFVYRISAREVDLTAKEVINGVKTCLETELVEVAVEGEVEPSNE